MSLLSGSSLDSPAEGRIIRDLPYVSDGHPRQKLDLYLSATPSGPLLVYIHGGSWLMGDKNETESRALFSRGFNVASLNYRYSTDAVFPAQIQDCKSAIRWLRAHAGDYGYDPKRIGVWGESAGGYLTALLATTGKSREFDVGENLEQSSEIQCAIDFFGPTDLVGWKAPTQDPTIQRSGGESMFVRLLGGDIEEKQKLAAVASPSTWASRDSAPLLIVHGSEDLLIPLEQSRLLFEKLQAAGADVNLDVISGAAHQGGLFWTEEKIQQYLKFFNKHLAH
ncbi:MAG: alpha/beta hydrolase [Verrucomicrobia bacterium]|nr:alpha/beta hydrolase [Verrucomicrobiota bacterium]